MSIKARRGFFLVTIMVVVVGALLLSVGISSPTEAQTATAPAPISGQVAVKATFLHADADDAPAPPTVVNLSAAGYKPGDTLKISYRVPPPGFSYYGCQGPFVGAEGVRLLGVFSSSSQLLEPSAPARVPGAIDAGEDAYVGPTYLRNAPVDIPQDFQVTPPSGFLIKIPLSATHLFLGIPDPYHGDNCGSGPTFDIETVQDTTAPVISGMPSDKTVEATGAGGAQVSWTAPTATDTVDGNVNVNCASASDLRSGGIFPLGTTTVTCSATDRAGNPASDSFTVTVEDTTAPALTVPSSPVVVEATGPEGAVVNFANDVSASDKVDPNPSVGCTPDSGSTFSLGPKTVSCKAKDASGNESDPKSFDVKVQDTTAPAIASHDDITEEATGPDGATVDYTSPGTTDAVDGPGTANCSPASGTKFALGDTTVECTATDKAGNKATPTTFTVTVEDTTAPSLTVPSSPVVVEATDASGATVNFANDVSASDAVDSDPSIDCTPASGTTFALETTQVSCTVKDATGNESDKKTFDVKVQDTTAPVISGMPSDVTEEATSSAGTLVNYTKPVANDAVDPSPVVTCSPAPGSTFPVGSTIVSCTAKDATGNQSDPETFKVNVVEENVAYEWSGFLQPINTPTNMALSPYTQSIFKIGSTVPVKFKLTGASAGITDGNFYLKYIRTGNGDGQGETEVVATATGSTGTQFRYDATAGQYIFNWSTKGITQAGNYEVRVYTDAAFTNLLGSQSIELK